MQLVLIMLVLVTTLGVWEMLRHALHRRRQVVGEEEQDEKERRELHVTISPWWITVLTWFTPWW